VLRIEVPMSEGFDEERDEFVTVEKSVLELEHSLVSLSKWESFYEKPFLSTMEKTQEQLFNYVVMMTLTPDVPLEVYKHISEENVAQIDEYINSKQTATWFNDAAEERSREIITAEIIYYWMVAMQIPFECQHWHLNRLLALVRVINLKNSPPKPMSSSEIAQRNRALNAQRKAQLKTTG
jgi:hypothetical protein